MSGELLFCRIQKETTKVTDILGGKAQFRVWRITATSTTVVKHMMVIFYTYNADIFQGCKGLHILGPGRGTEIKE